MMLSFLSGGLFLPKWSYCGASLPRDIVDLALAFTVQLAIGIDNNLPFMAS
ncbi:hypothetical protein PPEP_a1755 [Pseudoalteromonas peptidolytica F12-50-A1]|uniref:Uncharacterized protein n=1 Tax=Pseudoalteromonas peptidolytica F12-50-A1 TaxID=1315280 RepID=A0A8I0T5F2_9GAMM|nr:hypothetical protein [Pseudoalteromonas peptidolytica F12-50-A1]